MECSTSTKPIFLALCLILSIFFTWIYMTQTGKQAHFHAKCVLTHFDDSMMPYLMNRRFQFNNIVEHYMLPNNSIIDNMDDGTLYKTFSRYINQKQVTCCNVRRTGPRNTFGKNICLDNWNHLHNSCLVYSFGSQFQFQFENAIYRSYQCEIHTFDPSMSLEGHTIPERVNFHLIGLSDKDLSIPATTNLSFKSENNWEMRKLSTILQSLQHSNRIIDILKIDIEGWEWPALPQMLQSGVLKNVKQICLEVHFGYSLEYKFKDKKLQYTFSSNTWGNVTLPHQLNILKELYDYGFRIFKSDPIRGWAIWKKINTLVEISLVNSNID